MSRKSIKNISINDVKIGDKFGKWTVLKILPKISYKPCFFECQCECGTIKKVNGNNIVRGLSTNCGCVRKITVGNMARIDNRSKERLYDIYCKMKSRCNSPTNFNYKDYGGRGIKVCNEWLEDYLNFKNWALNNGYTDELTIDRINVNGDYEPSNCRWTTMDVQANNKRNNLYITHNGETKTLKEWCRYYNVKYDTIRDRMFRKDKHYTFEEAISKPIRIMITYNGETHSVTEWSKITGINSCLIRSRLRKGYHIEDVLYVGNLSDKYGASRYVPHNDKK